MFLSMPVLTFPSLSVLILHPVPPPFYPSELLNNREAVAVGMSQCGWGAGHLPSAHSGRPDGTATSQAV